MASAIDNGKLQIRFGWIGPTSIDNGWTQGAGRVNVIKLLFEGAKSQISIPLDPDIKMDPHQVTYLPFTYCRPVGDFTVPGSVAHAIFKKETYPDVLKVTPDQMRSLTIIACFFEESPHLGPATRDKFGRITYETLARKIDTIVHLDTPSDLKAGQLYRLVVTSQAADLSLSLTAKLEKM